MNEWSIREAYDDWCRTAGKRKSEASWNAFLAGYTAGLPRGWYDRMARLPEPARKMIEEILKMAGE